jgi:RimJ/RimL family protein N-acetyltransferase
MPPIKDENMIAESEEDIPFSPDLSNCPVLKTERLILRAPETADAADLTRLANNIKVAAMMTGMPHPYTRADAETFISRAAEPGRTGCTYALSLAQTGSVLGCAGLTIDKDNRLQLGFWLGEPHWGQGYATEAAHALVDLSFEHFKAGRLHTRCRLSNSASRRVIEKCGFQFTGIGLLSSIAVGQFSAEHFTLERRVWASLKGWR